LSREKKPSEPIKVTDKRIFTSEGDIREEFKTTVTPVDPLQQITPEPPPAKPAPEEPKKKAPRDPNASPATPFSSFIESLIVQAYMSLGMIRNPYGQGAVDLAAARQMIDIVTLLAEKTKGNLTEDEDDFLQTHLGELKLAFVQRSKTI
jgi:hypothetical protein